jgi:hypothetical protein
MPPPAVRVPRMRAIVSIDACTSVSLPFAFPFVSKLQLASCRIHTIAALLFCFPALNGSSGYFLRVERVKYDQYLVIKRK